MFLSTSTMAPRRSPWTPLPAPYPLTEGTVINSGQDFCALMLHGRSPPRSLYPETPATPTNWLNHSDRAMYTAEDSAGTHLTVTAGTGRPHAPGPDTRAAASGTHRRTMPNATTVCLGPPNQLPPSPLAARQIRTRRPESGHAPPTGGPNERPSRQRRLARRRPLLVLLPAQRPGHRECQVCGHPVHPPVGIHPADVELWALPHPSSGRRISAVRWLVEHGEPRAVRPLRGLAEGDDTDPVVAAAAARGLSMLRRTSRPHPVRSLPARPRTQHRSPE